ncbi:hypothetical protein D9M68_908790 [compost metagenome]
MGFGLCRQVEGGQLADQAFQRNAHLVDLRRLFQVQLADAHTAILLEHHQPTLFQHAERLAHRPTGNSHVRGDGRFTQWRTGQDAADRDAPLQLLMDDVRQ